MRHEAHSKVVRLRPKRQKSFGFIIFALIFVAIAATVALYYYLKVPTYVVIDGTVKKSFTGDALIIKKETLVTAEADGRLQLLVQPGERVRVNTPLFIITTDENKKETLQKQIEELENKIEDLKNVMKSSLPMSVLTKSIEEVSDQLKDAIAEGEFERVDELKKELSRLNDEKQARIEVDEANISALETHLEELKRNLTEVQYIQPSPASGIVSFNLDGFETIFSEEQAENISVSDIQSVETDEKVQTPPTLVALKQPVLKIVDNFSWHIAMKIESSAMEEGKTYEVTFPEIQDTLRAKLVSLHGNPKVGVFSINREIQNFADMRKTQVEIITDKKSGKLIPVSSIVEEDGTQGVYCLENRRRKFKPVDVLIQDDANAIVDGLKLGDKILLE